MIKKCLLFACALFTGAAMLSFAGCDKKPAPAPSTPAASDPAAPAGATPAAPKTPDH